jgi:hypothetical protein
LKKKIPSWTDLNGWLDAFFDVYSVKKSDVPIENYLEDVVGVSLTLNLTHTHTHPKSLFLNDQRVE